MHEGTDYVDIISWVKSNSNSGFQKRKQRLGVWDETAFPNIIETIILSRSIIKE